MAEVVVAGALSHSPLMLVPGTDGGAGAQRYREAAAALGRAVTEAGVDTVVLFFPDHFRSFRYDHTSPFCLGVKRLGTFGDWHLPRIDLEVDVTLAAHVLESVMAEGFDLAYSADQRIDHGGHQPLHVLGLEHLRVVPLFVNCAAPPLPALGRCAAFGAAVGRALRSFPDQRRVAVLGSGGLSHQVPLPSWESLDPSAGEPYRIFVTGVPDDELAEVEARRVERIRSLAGTADAWTDEDLDLEVLAELATGDLAATTARSPEELGKRGGSGMHEIRNWITAYAAAGAVGGEVLGYAAIPEWLTGMGVMQFTVGARADARG